MDQFIALFSLHNLFTLAMLVLLQAVLGFDNLLYISIESKRVEESKQAKVRRIGIGLAIFLRIALLFVVHEMISAFEDPFVSLGITPVDVADQGSAANGHGTESSVQATGWLAFAFNLESVVVLLGGAFILYTAVKEILHMVSDHDLEHGQAQATRSFQSALFWIVLMNLVFSFDSILSAMALTENLVVMSLAIIVSGVLMIVLADNVAEFLKKNRMYEVLGLFILFIVGVMLVSEGGHKAHLHFFGHPVHAMQKTTFYFVIGVLVIVDIVQSKYKQKLLAEAARRQQQVAAADANA